MATLTTNISESITLNGSLRGSTNTVTTTGINDVFERIVTCTTAQTTVLAQFATEPYTTAGAIDVDRTKYIRVTNLDLAAVVELAVVTTATSYTVTLTAGQSHILCQAAEVVLGEASTSPSFGTMQDLRGLQVRPVSTESPRIELFVGIE